MLDREQLVPIHSLLPEPNAVLEIISGVAQHPQRPISECVFLIGGAPQCDLIVGGDDVPPIHSCLVSVSEGIELKHSGEGQQPIVNGEPTSRCIIQDGDEFEIMGITFALRIPVANPVSPTVSSEISDPFADRLLDEREASDGEGDALRIYHGPAAQRDGPHNDDGQQLDRTDGRERNTA